MTKISNRLSRGLGALLLFVTLISGCTGAGQITVAVTNNTAQPIQAVVVKFTGGATQLGPLKIGERLESTIKPTGESHIELEIHPLGGQVEHRAVDTYFEAGYRGKIEITLDKKFVVHSTEQISVR